jgi:parvulin-like peptidyl-prolyl isomerase
MARRRKIPTPSWEHSDSGTLARRLDANRWQILATAGVVLLVLAALAVVGWGFLSDWIEDQQRPGTTAIKVLNRDYTVRDFSERAELYVDENGGQNNALFVIPTVSNELIEEAILLQFAVAEGAEPATEDDINQQIALLLGITVDDPNFDARLQEELDTTGLTEEEYRDRAEGFALKGHLTTKFQNDIPETLHAVHYRQIRVADQESADMVVAELEGGADFAAMYIEHSIDYNPDSDDESGGDEGFVPDGILPDQLETFLAGLDDGEITTYPGNSSVSIIEKIEESDAQAPTDEQKSQLAANAYSDWYAEQRDSLNIVNEMDFQEGDGDKINWVIDHAGLVVG